MELTEDYIEIPKTHVVSVERIFGRGKRDVLTTPNGKLDILEEGEIFALRVKGIIQTYHILQNGEIQRANLNYKIIDNG